MNKAPRKNAIIYQAKSGAVELRGDFRRETVWATQAQIAAIFGTQRPAITKHLRNVFISEELKEKTVSSILEHTAADGKTYLRNNLKTLNLCHDEKQTKVMCGV